MLYPLSYGGLGCLFYTKSVESARFHGWLMDVPIATGLALPSSYCTHPCAFSASATLRAAAVMVRSSTSTVISA